VNIEIHVAAKTTFGAPQWFEDFLVQENLHRSEYRAITDHPRHYKNVALLHPYYAIGEDLLVFLEACKRRGLTVDIGGTSNYYPSATFRIAVYDPKDQEQFSEYFGKQQIFTAKVPDDYVGEEG
jgi:hypothetical protein